ncbi:hypothetical protein ACFO25_15950 [Paenactinomyces guangxiensis]|uniref:Uncharacterized protein n=1 Tax=Paenactinomyces guangxiensis TaxID=1490290 RepID=A0A7W1WV02_9BACL|nr:hypothetical protein [Paenactinomyces guangxiensis]MBA4496551.1 hypothetical protein [Paenactinomyces guangxiensis]MBH8593619.1 hypothetical protein [Paenactinomyces guangxiensis]
MSGVLRKFGVWFGLVIMIFAILLSGCTSNTASKDLTKMAPEEEKKVKEAAVNYIKTTYAKDFVVEEVQKGQVFGDTYDIKGYMQDEKKTVVHVIGTPPDNFRDSYVDRLWTNELEPHIKEIVNKTVDLRKIDDLSYSDGTEKTKYKGNIPSVFDVLKKGEKDFSLLLVVRIYQHGGQEKEDIAKLLNELKKMNFNDVTLEIFVHDDQLKSAPKNEDPGKHLLVRYNISGDIQTIDFSNLDKYKTQIKESK